MQWLHSTAFSIFAFAAAIALFVVLMVYNAADFAREARWWEHRDDP